jgi:AraC-like DNA-binding protein
VNGIHLYESKHQESYAVNIHHHHNYQILYAIEGKGTIALGGKVYDFAQDNAAVIVPYTEHAVSSDSHLTLLVLAFDEASLYYPMQPEWKEHYFPHSELLKLNLFSGSELRLLLRKLLFVQKQKDPLSGWALNIHLLEILLLLAKAKQTLPVTDANGLRAERIRNYIDVHYFESLTSEDLADKLGISIRHLNHIFKELYQITPMQYLTEVRIGIAKMLLTQSDKDIVTICFEVGYESLPTFYRTFKNTVSMSPNKYRQLDRESLDR